jgi:menaquinol-cytochrome c reductase iron-sulfur subunit
MIQTNSENAASNQPPPEERRNFFVEAAAVVIGGMVGLFPVVAGLGVIFDPLFGKKKGPGGKEVGGGFVRITKIDSLPENGRPQQFPVVSDRLDAWNYFPNERIGSVFIRRVNENEVQVFNSVCPHLGCLVSYAEGKDQFHCPCHNSAFQVHGEKIDNPSKPNPSPRALDTLEIDSEKLTQTGEIWVKFQNFYTGKEQKVAK